ncbi:Arf-GAP with coiled-coil, ANK repeat and PH domain-containing protein 3 [Liparis tanakae]|uniref:Arf-GAP with coiled-coil, ANK repeat and PH domain-containing protein n=1 Tax=Liparis tanakae TaxID=230148 RepID=A0A4Z2GB04_9TELE|nr:Arf-GAP with coiled-coil, ANK repeat and PH domain-containing protein 3 [Liparis tanakae]
MAVPSFLFFVRLPAASSHSSQTRYPLESRLKINVLQAKKKFEILDAMLSFMNAQYSLFQQGYNLLDEINPYMKKLATELDQLVIDSAMEKREMEHKHATIQQRAGVWLPFTPGSVTICHSAPLGSVPPGSVGGATGQGPLTCGAR